MKKLFSKVNKLFVVGFLFLFTSMTAFSQTWTGTYDGKRYQLTETSTGDYILKMKSEYGTVCSSKLTVYKSNSNGQYCTERMISGTCEPWSEVRLVWYDIPSTIHIYPAVKIIVGDGFDTEEISLFNPW